MQVFPGWNISTVAQLVNWGPITFVIFMIPVCFGIEKYGLRKATIVGASFMMIGTCLQVVAIVFLPSVFTV